MRSSRIVPLLLCFVMLSASIAGCLGSSGDSDKAPSPIDMIVYYETTSGTIVEEIRSGSQISENGVELSFDFARTTSQNGQMKSFYVVPGDGTSQFVANADETAEISYTYMTHGLFTVYLGAVDDQGNDNNISITVRIEKQIIWSDQSTDDPREMNIDTQPDCECQPPEFIQIESTITNPDNGVGPFGGGAQNTVSWHLNDPDEVEQGTHSEIIGEGQDASWNYDQYNVVEGIWILSVLIDQGTDNIDVNHDVTIKYLTEESEPNPFPVGEE
ncbi:MAG: PKD domain-containing protein [Euryarchaeota archaeon]